MENKLEIKFKNKVVYLDEFNHLANKFWPKSKWNHIKNVEFCLNNVEFIFPMQACQLFSWIEELLKLGKYVQLFLDESQKRNTQLFAFLYRHSFFLKIDAYKNFKCERLEYSQIPILMSKFSDYSIDFSAFEDQESFNRFLGKQAGAIDKSNNVSLRVNDYFLDLKRNLTNIVIKEIGSNVFIHNKNSPAYLVVTEQNSNHLLGLNNIPKFIKKFIKESQNREFLEVVITDLGKGICETLKEDFKKNKEAMKFFNNEISNSNILQYALWRESSRKDRIKEERIFEDEDLPDLVLPSGLFFCKELVEATNGLIIIQCNGELCTYIYDKTKLQYIETNKWLLKEKPLNKGTSISILIPKRLNNLHTKPIEFDNRLVKVHKVLGIISWQYTTSDKYSDIENIRKFCLAIGEEAAVKQQEREIGTLVIDLSNYGSQSKYLYKIICYSMFHARPKLAILLANIPEEILNESAIKELLTQARSTAFFDKIFWYGKTLTGTIDVKGTIHSVNFDKTQIENQVRIFNQEYLKQKIESTRVVQAKAYIPKPSNSFIQGYYELSKVIEEPNFCFSAVDLISNQNIKFDFIIQTTEILSFISKTLSKKHGLSPDRVITLAAEDGLGKLTLDIKKNNYNQALILTDVIASGATVNRIENSLIAIKCTSETVAFVKNSTTPDIKYAFITENLTVYEQKPDNWRLKEVREVNTKNNTLILEKTNERKLAELDVFEKWADKMEAIYVGHIRYGSLCYLSFFDTLKIVQQADIYFITQIVNQAEAILKISKAPLPEILLLHASSNDESKKICSRIYEKINKVPVKIRSFSKFKIASKEFSSNNDNNRIVFFIDTAISTTTTFKYALEWASANDCKEFHSYIFIDRTKSTNLELIEGIQKYKNVTVEHNPIYRVYAPFFESNCPICELSSKLESFNEYLQNGILKRSIIRWTSILKFHSPMSDIKPPSIHTKVHGVTLYARHLIELCILKSYDLTLIDKTRSLIENFGKKTEYLESLVEVMWLESYSFSNTKTEPIDIQNTNSQIPDIIKKQLYTTVVVVLKSKNCNIITIDKALWLLASLNFSQLLYDSKKINKTIALNTDTFCTFGLVCCWLTKNEMIPKVEETLKNIFLLTDHKNTEIYKQNREILLETLTYLSLKKHTPKNTCDFNISLNKVRELFEQENKAHTDSCQLFTKRVNTANNIKNLLSTECYQEKMKQVYTEMFKHLEIILSAIRKQEAKYNYLTKRSYKSDFDTIVLELDRLTKLARTQSITDKEIIEIQNQYLDDFTDRFNQYFIYKENSLVWELIQSCKCNLVEAIGCQQNQIHTLYSEKKINFQFNNCNKTDIITCIPSESLNEILYTLIDNAYKYSDINTNILVTVDRLDSYISLTIESYSKTNSIKLVDGHGLTNSKKILLRFNAVLELNNEEPRRIIQCKLPYLEA